MNDPPSMKNIITPIAPGSKATPVNILITNIADAAIIPIVLTIIANIFNSIIKVNN